MHPMVGNLEVDGVALARAGFLPTPLGNHGYTPGESRPIFNRSFEFSPEVRAVLERSQQIQRGEIAVDAGEMQTQLAQAVAEIQRAITSTVTGFPVRENLEAEAKILVPLDTPVRNTLPRIPGSGLSSLWRQATSLGGGYGVVTTVTSGASSATQTVGSSANMVAGDTLYFATTNATRVISSITNATTVVLTATISTTTGETVIDASFAAGAQGQAGPATITNTLVGQSFYPESGAPADHGTVYAAKSAAYKLLGTFGSVTGFAMAAGANFQNQLAFEKTAAIRNLMLNEEAALLLGSSTSTDPPYGNGTTAYGFDGLLNLVTTANGTPSAQVQTSVGALTLSHIDNQLARLWKQGAQQPYLIVSYQEALSLVHLANASGSIIRVQASAQADTILGVSVTGWSFAQSKAHCIGESLQRRGVRDNAEAIRH